MKTIVSQHINQIDWNIENEAFFSRLEFSYPKTKAEIWDEMEGKLAGNPQIRIRRINKTTVFMAVAASVALLLGAVSLMWFYTRTISAGTGEHLTATLPDQSTVTLNAQSTLKFHPYWWFVTRKIDFTGEGFFEVSKGRKFEVNSSNGKTIVLGTSFNIYSRDQLYEVTCVTGKVKVVSPTLEEAVLTADYHARIGQNGGITVTKLNNPEDAAGWTEDMFNFNSVPLSRVIAEIGRQYNVAIELNIQSDLIYTGYFSKDKPVEDVLNLICKPFGLTFVKKSDRQYLINQK